MKNIFYVFFLTTFIFSQEVDPDLLKNLDRDVIKEKFELEFEGESESEVSDPTLEQVGETEEEIIEETKVLEIFGLDFISTSPTSISATTDLPFPNDYRVSLPIEIRVILTGTKEDIYNLKLVLMAVSYFPNWVLFK